MARSVFYCFTLVGHQPKGLLYLVAGGIAYPNWAWNSDLEQTQFPLTPLAYCLILIHCIILMIGGHYTYAEVPVGEWFNDMFGWQRNNYDKLGHVAQGFVPAIIVREIFIRKQVVVGKQWCNFLVCCFCLAFSAFYELLEWWVALISGTEAEAFLGTQGYQWDTQSDMLLALPGALLALIILSGLHSRQLKELEVEKCYVA